MIRPLTKKNKDGVLYTRPNHIQNEIAAALAVDDPLILIEKAKKNPGSPDFMTSECLVYLIREDYRHGDDKVGNLLMPYLMERCRINLEKTIPAGRVPDAASVREDILGEFFLLFAEDVRAEPGNQLDFFEVKFNRAFQTFRADALRSVSRHTKQIMELSEASDEEGDPLTQEERLAQLSSMARTNATQESDLLFKQMMKMAQDLPDDMREAFVLCCVMDHTHEQAAAKCGVKERTIFNRLRAAEKHLQALEKQTKRRKEK